MGPLLKPGLPLMKNILKLLTKSVLIPLGLTIGALATDAAIQKKMFGSGTTTLLISNEEINDIMEIGRSLAEPGFLKKNVTETIKNEAKTMLLGTLSASLLGNLLSVTGTIRAGEGVMVTSRGWEGNMPDTVRASEGTIRAGQNL